MNDARIAFKAGRAFRRENTNWVDPSPTKGAIILRNGDDGLLHFIWRNRVTNEAEEVSAKVSLQKCHGLMISISRTLSYSLAMPLSLRSLSRHGGVPMF